MGAFKDFLTSQHEKNIRRNPPHLKILAREVAKLAKQVEPSLRQQYMTIMRTKPLDERKAEMRPFIGRGRAIELIATTFDSETEAIRFASRLITKIHNAGYQGELYPAAQQSSFTAHRRQVYQRKDFIVPKRYFARIIVIGVDNPSDPEESL